MPILFVDCRFANMSRTLLVLCLFGLVVLAAARPGRRGGRRRGQDGEPRSPPEEQGEGEGEGERRPHHGRRGGKHGPRELVCNVVTEGFEPPADRPTPEIAACDATCDWYVSHPGPNEEGTVYEYFCGSFDDNDVPDLVS